MLSIMTLTQAGLPLASARSMAGQIGGTFDKLAMAAERRHDLIVARRQQLAAVHAVGAIVAALNFALRVPARIVAEDGDERQRAADGGFEFG